MKRLARSVASCNARFIAIRSLAIPRIKLYITTQIGHIMRNEMKHLCADKFQSIYRDTSKLALQDWSVIKVFDELLAHAPVLTTALMESCPNKKSVEEKKVAVVMSTAVLLKFRNPKMKLIAAIFSLILQAGHAGRQVQLGCCMVQMYVHYNTCRLIGDCRRVCFHCPLVLLYISLIHLVKIMMPQLLPEQGASYLV